jgi:surfeit locus 1 family protein
VTDRAQGAGRTAKVIVAAVLVAIVCVALGVWQLARLQQKRDANAAIRAGLAAPALLVDAAFPAGDPVDALRYRRARARGTFDTSQETILYGRTQDGQAGNHLLTPLLLTDGSAIVVDRGWVPLALDDPPVAAARPPDGAVTVDGVLFASEGDPPSAADPSAPRATTLSRLDLATLQAQLPYRIAPVYLLLREQTPAQSDLPRPTPLPELSEGPHLSYAIQWFCFAAIAVIGGVVLVRRDHRDRTAPVDSHDAPPQG